VEATLAVVVAEEVTEVEVTGPAAKKTIQTATGSKSRSLSYI
jgi:hypothetical protein